MISFELDPRIELLSALLLLARPRRVRLTYADAVRERFSPFSGHPAVAGLRRLLERGVPEHLFSELALLLPDARGLATPELAAFFAQARDVSERSRSEAFFKARRKDRARFVALARKEAAKGQRPEDVFAYLRLPFAGPYRLILAPLLPREFAVNVSRGGEELRVRAGSFGRGGLTFEFGEFDCCVAHELTHAALAPLTDGSRGLLDAAPGRPPRTCRDAGSWSGCVEEHLVRAVTLRVLRLTGDEKRSGAILRRWSRSGYPYLEWFCGRLEAFERAPGSGTFAEFYPGLLAAFLLESGT